MAITDQNHLSFTPDVEYTQEELLSFNPFAESSSSARGRSTAFQLSPSASYTNGSSTVSRSSSHRRRASGNLVLERQNSSSSNHRRSRTEFDIKANSLHPLKSAGLRPDTGNTGITRPSLERLVKEGRLVDVLSSPNEEDAPTEGEEEKEVFVHQVRPGDSLAGVSLKYGIGLADLRRANHLWASDSIHLRTVLYIPVEQATRLKKLPPKPVPQPEAPTEPLDELDELDRISSPKTARPPVPEEAIQRIPASQLSFFPPPSTRSATHSPVSESGQTFSAVGSLRSSPYNPRGPGQTSSLTSLLTALPIAASTRDDIVSRLSLDSVSSSYSDRDSETTSEDLELDDVGAKRRRRPDHVSVDHPDTENPDSFSMVTPKVRQDMHRTSEATIVDPRSVTHARHLSISPPAYIPPHTQIRTQQLEPSAGMQLPRSKSGRSKSGKDSKKDAVLIDVELHTTSNSVL